MKLGIQGFGLQDMPAKDPKGFFETLYSFGYRLFEPCLTFEELPFQRWSVWTESVIEQNFAIAEEAGLHISSVHLFGDPEKSVGKIAALADRHGFSQLVLGLPRELTEETLRTCAESYCRIAEQLAAHGVELLVHNGGAEPTGMTFGGVTAYEYLLDCCGEAVGMQPDIGWVAAGGVDETEFCRRNVRRIKSLHYKDRENGEERPVGKGKLDSFGCYQLARYSGISQIVDMDTCTLEDVEAAARLLLSFQNERGWTRSVLCTLNVATGTVTERSSFDEIIEAPNWLADGDTLLYNAEGNMWRYHLSTGKAEKVETGNAALRCSNDHVPSPDGKLFGVTAMEMAPEGFCAPIYLCPLEGGEPKKLTHEGASWLHGWSPDGKELAFCAFRDDRVDIYTMPADGGEETCVTDGAGYNDGPEYSPDGKHIWFNSTRSGLMQAWRMDRDGGNLTQMTHTEHNEWFPHVSPDGKKVVYLTFRKEDLDPHEHLANLWVSLNIMDHDGQNSRKLLDFFGGQGSVNVNSWSPDSRQIAFVKYERK